MINGFINLNKPNTVSSNKALGILKYALRQIGIKEKIGHFGTLDPLAEGVLPVALGRATRLFDYSIDKTKIYEAEFIFGAHSDSLDLGTDVTYVPFSMPEKDKVIDVLKSQCGEIMQLPPVYSAKSVGGVRAYKFARQGETPELKPKLVNIKKIELIKIECNKITVNIECGGGTYIRAIGRDVAKKFGTTAVTTKLIRLKSGIFSIDKSISLAEIENNPKLLVSNIIPMTDFVGFFKKIFLQEDEKQKLLNGIRIPTNMSKEIYALYCAEHLLGLGSVDETGRLYVKTWLL